jgi:hypothetical protein
VKRGVGHHTASTHAARPGGEGRGGTAGVKLTVLLSCDVSLIAVHPGGVRCSGGGPGVLLHAGRGARHPLRRRTAVRHHLLRPHTFETPRGKRNRWGRRSSAPCVVHGTISGALSIPRSCEGPVQRLTWRGCGIGCNQERGHGGGQGVLERPLGRLRSVSMTGAHTGQHRPRLLEWRSHRGGVRGDSSGLVVERG